jgi:hypothetical protein
MMSKLILISVAAVVLYLGAYGPASWRKLIGMPETHLKEEDAVARSTQPWRDVHASRWDHAKIDSLPALDAHGFNGVQEITRPELLKLMAEFRSLSQDENANLDRGCPGFACVYQGLGVKTWPELARGTVAYLSRADALKRRCPNGQQNFIFLKQGCWLTDKPPTPDPTTGEVPLNSITRSKPGLYTFNYAVYFPSTATYAWMNHRDYRFPVNRFKPQKAYLSPFPPPLNDRTRPAQIYCSTCR